MNDTFLRGSSAGTAEACAELVKPSRSYSCVETKCVAIGDPRCEFKLIAQESKQGL